MKLNSLGNDIKSGNEAVRKIWSLRDSLSKKGADYVRDGADIEAILAKFKQDVQQLTREHCLDINVDEYMGEIREDIEKKLGHMIGAKTYSFENGVSKGDK